MAGILVVGEVAPDGSLTKLSTEVATLARQLGDAGAGAVTGLVAAPKPEAAAETLASFLPTVLTDATFTDGGTATQVAAAIADLDPEGADLVMLPASPEGRDLAGALSAMTGRGVLANATDVRWDDGAVSTHSVFGGKLVTEGAFTSARGIITIRPNSVVADPIGARGTVQPMTGGPIRDVAQVELVEKVEAQGAAVSIDDARIIVSGGRGVGGPDGFALLRDLADELGGAVGASRAAVDSGWIPYAQQIGQTGKIVKPQLYLAMGISGAIQHKVGMQTAETIIAVNRDPDAPIADFADVVVIGDLFEVGQALLDQLRARSG